jgi:prepilin-type N-terminal cleavage/methylation domain-containing protein
MKSNRFKNCKAFTLIELLTVISIIVLLVGIVMPVLNRVRERSFITRTRAQIASVELALTMFEADTGQIPFTSGNVVDLPANWFLRDRLSNPNNRYYVLGDDTIVFNVPNWNGPYMEFRQRDLEIVFATGVVTDTDIFRSFVIDSWGRRLKYRCPGTNREYELFSAGIDGVVDNGDDISNWQ